MNFIKTIWSFVYRAFQKLNKYEIPPSFENKDPATDSFSEAHGISMFMICKEIREHVNLLLNKLGSDIFLVKNFEKSKEPQQVQYDQKKQSLR